MGVYYTLNEYISHFDFNIIYIKMGQQVISPFFFYFFHLIQFFLYFHQQHVLLQR